jgi:hypothetical protein
MDTRNGKLGDLKVFSSTGGFAEGVPSLVDLR